MKARLADLGLEPLANSPAEFGNYIVQYTEKWGKVVRVGVCLLGAKRTAMLRRGNAGF